VGTLGAIPLHLVLRALNPTLHTAAVVAISAVGIWASDEAARELDEKDPQRVVIDEVAGVLTALRLVRGRGIKAELMAIVLFRVFDIAKPGPVKRAERAQPAGLGIMLDDLVAGLMAGAVSRWLS
jgi:phosphatidylglycerophosphatase A